MSQVGRSIKNLEAPRPLKSQSRSNLNKSNYIVIEELIQLIENVAATLASGISNQEAMHLLVQNLRLHGPQMESVSKDTLDRAFVTFRNASQDERLNIMTRLNLLELIELRAKSWKDDGANTYYKAKATNVEPDSVTGAIIDQSSVISTSPQALVTSASVTVAGGQQQSQQMNQSGPNLLGPGEVIRNSGKFSKPTKIPGKNYSKDEVVIRNADSGKVMGIKGRRVHMIEELSETIISFQRVNPGAKERLVQITGPTEEKINYAKQLIEDTIRRNASPVRLEPIATQPPGNEGAGSCSSLASSNSDEVNMRSGVSGHHLNRNSIGAVIPNMNYVQPAINSVVLPNMMATGGMVPQSGISKRLNPSVNGSGQQPLLHSFSTNDATLGEYKYTVNVGHHIIKITGDNCELVRAAKLVLDDYFSSNEFLASVEAGAAFDNSILNSTSTPTTPLTGAPSFTPHSHQLSSSTPFADSGIGLNYMAGQISSSSYIEGDDDVFIIEENGTPTPVNGLSRSRRSHFSRKDSTPPDSVKNKTTETAKKEDKNNVRIVHEYERLIYYAKSPHSWALPRDWQKIIDKHPSLVRNKDLNDVSNRFDADKYLQMVKTNGKRTIAIDDGIIDVDAQDNE